MAGSGNAHLRTQSADVLLAVERLVVDYPISGGSVQAVSGVSFDVVGGETLGVVGESGCGKTSVGRAVMQLPKPTSGSVRFEGADLTTLDAPELRRVRQRLQMILQDPISSLNPRRRVRDLVAEGLRIWKRPDHEVDARVDEILTAVGLDPETVGDRRPGEFSGGQCQRICIARALALEPQLIICDEPVSALDVSVQAQILNLLHDMKQRFGLTLVFIAHDLGVVKNVSDRVVVMYLGKICEVGPPDEIFEHPQHPYTSLLLESVPTLDRERIPRGVPTPGDAPSPLTPPSGCRFRTRCPAATERCAAEEPVIRRVGDDHYVACHLAPVPTVSSRRRAT